MSDNPTSTDFMNYNEIVEKALKGVVREALNRAASTGLPGDHHFYISIATSHADVELPSHLRERYPQEITIVLQHEFWDLDINDEGFSVTLSFNNKREFIGVPWAAITGFADPSVQFGLQFKTIDESNADVVADITKTTVNSLNEKFTPNADGDETVSNEVVRDEARSNESASNEADDAAKPATAEVLVLDQFRKK